MQYCRDPCSLLCPSKTAGAFRTTAALHHKCSYYCWSGLLGKQLYSALETFLFFLCCCCADTARGVLDKTGWTATVSRVRAMSAGLLVGVLEGVSSTHCVTASSTHCVTALSAYCVTASSTHCVTASSWHCSWGGIAAAAAGSSADCVAGGWVPILWALCACALLNVVLVLAMMPDAFLKSRWIFSSIFQDMYRDTVLLHWSRGCLGQPSWLDDASHSITIIDFGQQDWTVTFIAVHWQGLCSPASIGVQCLVCRNCSGATRLIVVIFV